MMLSAACLADADVALVGSGCSGTPSPKVELPGVSITLQQTREDIRQRKIEIRVLNGSDELLTSC